MANESKADLFLSIHANSSPYPSVSGVETYYLNFTSTREAMDVASRENAGSEKSIHELTRSHPEDHQARQGGRIEGVRQQDAGVAVQRGGAAPIRRPRIAA